MCILNLQCNFLYGCLVMASCRTQVFFIQCCLRLKNSRSSTNYKGLTFIIIMQISAPCNHSSKPTVTFGVLCVNINRSRSKPYCPLRQPCSLAGLIFDHYLCIVYKNHIISLDYLTAQHLMYFSKISTPFGCRISSFLFCMSDPYFESVSGHNLSWKLSFRL